MILYLIAQAAAVVLPPPLVMTPVVAPPAPATPPAPRRADVRMTLDVRVEVEGARLFDGPLRISPNGNTMVRREQSEPPEIVCDRPFPGGSSAHGLVLTLAPSYGYTNASGAPVSVLVRWTRPAPANCGVRQGARVVELSDIALVNPGKETVLTGDGGLRVTLRPR